MITKHQFTILTTIEKFGNFTQRELASKTFLSLGTVNKEYKYLTEQGYIKEGKITEQGFEALEPYRVKRAVFIAAGFGARLVPITLNTPKPLVRVHGKRLIERSIDACLEAGIYEIYIVRGYLAEEFDQLISKYPMIKFIENPKYNETNNISSAVAAAQYLESAYIFEADLLLKNYDLISKYQYRSNYIGVKVDRTDDWCLHTKPNGQITKMESGGIDCYHMFGISYWTKEDGKKLAHDLPLMMKEPGGQQEFWDSCPLGLFKNNYKVFIRPCSFDDITEIDTFNELKKIDPAYK